MMATTDNITFFNDSITFNSSTSGTSGYSVDALTGVVNSSSELPGGGAAPTQDIIALDAVLFRIAIAFAVLGTFLFVVLVATVSLNYSKYKARKKIERNVRTNQCTYNNPIDILTHDDLLVEEIQNRPEYGSLTSSPTEITDSTVPDSLQNGDIHAVPRLEFMQDAEEHHDVGSENQFSYVSLEV